MSVSIRQFRLESSKEEPNLLAMAPKRSSTTILTYRHLSPKVQHDLAIALGYTTELGEVCETPYIKEILGHWPGKGTLDDYIRLFVNIIEYFTRKHPSE